MEVQWKDLIERAKNNDQGAFSALYEHSYDAVYRTVKSMVKDEDTAMDIVQDAFVSGFAHLDSFQPPENFIPWMRRIATNKARDWFRKKHDLTFSQLADEEGNLPEFKDENPDHAPEAVLDRSETTRLIEEILGTLSEEQRIAVGMYYYEEMSVAEIAETLGVSENTVKSRLNYGRKKIKAGVEELEKKGTKLYSLAPVPFFMWLLHSQKALPAAGKAPVWLLENILARVGVQAAAGAAGGAAAAGAAAAATKTGFLSTLGAKIAAGVLATVLVGGGVAAGVSFANRGDPAPEQSQTQMETTPEEIPETAPGEETTPGEEAVCEALGHTWVEATCTTPRTCSVCGETEGKALDHTWVEATCTTPRACSVCGETEGEVPGHTWAEANYQEAATCSVCGETEGEPLTPDFVTYGIAADLKVGETYVYETGCFDNPFVTTVGALTVLDYTVVASDETYEAKEGYAWRIATFQLAFSDYYAREYGYRYGFRWEDYYNIRLHDDSGVYDDDGNGTFLVNYHGREMECRYISETLENGWQGSVAKVVIRVSVQVPVGYDGFVYGFRKSTLEVPEDSYLFDIYEPDSFLLFRFSSEDDIHPPAQETTPEEIPEPTPEIYSEGLEFALNDAGDGYIVVGIGSCEDTEVVIPSEYEGLPVVGIGDSAFRWCTDLTSIVIPDGVTSIGDSAFIWCNGLTSIVIPGGVTSIGVNVFENCQSLTSITVEPENSVYHSAGNCIIETATNTLVLGCKTSVIPENVTSIGDSAFASHYLTSIVIPDSVTSIGPYAFRGCIFLTSVTIPDGVTSIGDNAFSFCQGLTSIVIPDSVTSIGTVAFEYCKSLTSIQFGGTMADWEAILKGAFWNECTGNYTVICSDGTVQK